MAARVNRWLGFVPTPFRDSRSRQEKGFPQEESAATGRRRLAGGIIFSLEASDCCPLVEAPQISPSPWRQQHSAAVISGQVATRTSEEQQLLLFVR